MITFKFITKPVVHSISSRHKQKGFVTFRRKSIKLLAGVLLLFSSPTVDAQGLNRITKSAIEQFLNESTRQMIVCGKIAIDSVAIKDKTIAIYTNINFSYVPFREDNVKDFYDKVKALLPEEYASYQVEIYTDKRPIEKLIPLAFRSQAHLKEMKKGKKVKKGKKTIKETPEKTFVNVVNKPLVTRTSEPFVSSKGLQNRHIALWQSHGYYYESKLARWEWQRARIFQTVEDLYTQSFVLPFLIPMLENAGANVIIPRERDTQTHEVIVDNDSKVGTDASYKETDGSEHWTQGDKPGFAHLRSEYKEFENPFKEGTYRQTNTIKRGQESFIEWIPTITESGTYAVYVSYQTVENSTDDALYTIYHKGGISTFKVNQTMGGGTWIYLGHFAFDAGMQFGKVTLTNRSKHSDKVITADGIKVGGGYGNIARRVSPSGTTANVKSSEEKRDATDVKIPTIVYPYETSGYPRFCEAARYWMQWAGVPDSIYSESRGKNDYTDDYKSRGHWVNYIAGGSSANPKEKGLNIPVDLAFAFHSDAGTTYGDSIIGTLGIFDTESDDGVFANGASRYASRDLTDIIQSSIVNDIKALHAPEWSRRGMWNKSYFEARVPRVPTMLLELLSHQNFADMRYGLDPRFRFTVSRAIYKGMLKFMASQYHTDYVVQPLPVDHMQLKFTDSHEAELTWQAVTDSLEPSAKAEQYIVYKRVGDADFDQGTVVKTSVYRCSIPTDVVCSFKVCALNKGGKSFPSEILSIARSSQDKGCVLVVNGFDRISGPADFTANADTLGGFLDQLDHGVPYLNDISYIGSQKEFRRQIPWMDDDASGFGDSYGTYETKVIAGNSFDYPSVHGEAILKAGYSFVSCSDESVEQASVKLTDYKLVDLILGKECQTKTGRGGVKPLAFKTFSTQMQKAITDLCNSKGSLFVSGAYVGTDLWDSRVAKSLEADKTFATEVLKYKWRVGQAAQTRKVKSVPSPLIPYNGNYNYHHELNAQSYAVESPDAIEPADNSGAFTVYRYGENNLSAGVAYKGAYKTCVLGFPFESIQTTTEREQLMKTVLDFFENK